MIEIYREGFISGSSGEESDCNPYIGEMGEYWAEGWIEGNDYYCNDDFEDWTID